VVSLPTGFFSESSRKEAFALWWIFRQGKAKIGDQFAWSKLEQLRWPEGRRAGRPA
jgi:hypothetical protein